MSIFSTSTTNLENALNVASLKQRVISSNVANVDTPNYKSKEVSFQSALLNAVEQQKGLKSYRTSEKHLPFSTHQSAISHMPK